ncbi:hypothetical protein [Marinomonas primoryensis]
MAKGKLQKPTPLEPRPVVL